jgi:hypothetical protein
MAAMMAAATMATMKIVITATISKVTTNGRIMISTIMMKPSALPSA